MKVRFGPFLLAYRGRNIRRSILLEDNDSSRNAELAKLFERYFGFSVTENDLTVLLCNLVIDTEKLDLPTYAFCYPDEFKKLQESSILGNVTTNSRNVSDSTAMAIRFGYAEEDREAYFQENSPAFSSSDVDTSEPTFVPPTAYGATVLELKGVLTASFIKKKTSLINIKLSDDVDPDVFVPVILKYGYFEQISALLNEEKHKPETTAEITDRRIKALFNKKMTYELYPRLDRRSYRFTVPVKTLLFISIDARTVESPLSFFGTELMFQPEDAGENRFQGFYVIPKDFFEIESPHHSLNFKTLLDWSFVCSAYSDILHKAIGMNESKCTEMYWDAFYNRSLASLLRGTGSVLTDIRMKSYQKSYITPFVAGVSKMNMVIRSNVELGFLKSHEICNYKHNYMHHISGFALLVSVLAETAFERAGKQPVIIMSHSNHVKSHSFSRTCEIGVMTNITDVLETMLVNLMKDKKKTPRSVCTLGLERGMLSDEFTRNYVECYLKPLKEVSNAVLQHLGAGKTNRAVQTLREENLHEEENREQEHQETLSNECRT